MRDFVINKYWVFDPISIHKLPYVGNRFLCLFYFNSLFDIKEYILEKYNFDDNKEVSRSF